MVVVLSRPDDFAKHARIEPAVRFWAERSVCLRQSYLSHGPWLVPLTSLVVCLCWI